jgi:hypothetical protein
MRPLEYERKQNLTWGNDSRCVGEIPQFESPFDTSLERFVYQFNEYTSNLNIKFEFRLRTYNRYTSTTIPLEYGQSSFIDRQTSEFGYFWHC